MAKNTLDFIDRRSVKVLNHAGPIALSKDDCGRVIVLNSASGHDIALPSVAEAGAGWHSTFVLGTVQTDLVARAVSSIIAKAGETITLTRRAVDSGVAAQNDTGVAAIDEVIDCSALPANGEQFTIVVGAAAGGTGTTFTFTIRTNEAGLTAANAMTAGNFEISLDLPGNAAAQAGHMALIIVDMLNGVDPASRAGIEATMFRLPPDSTEGSSKNRGVKGRYTASVTNTDRVTITMDADAQGALAPAAITLANVGGADIVSEAGTIQAAADTAGVAEMGTTLSGQRVQFEPSGGVIGDRVDVELVNGQWHAFSRTASQDQKWENVEEK